jgi:alpha-amylase/alpha-mannosidase (GH57 family)
MDVRNTSDTLKSIITQERTNFETAVCPNGRRKPIITRFCLGIKRDKQTQIQWGMREFQTRFGHPAEGIWLPEAAVDKETLSVACDCGVKYVILAPWQCSDRSANLAHTGVG